MEPVYTTNHQQIPPAIGAGVTDARCCADCTSYPLSFHDHVKFCRTVMDTVSLLTPACKKQPERVRAPSIELERLKLRQAKTLLERLSRRLRPAMDRTRSLAAQRKRQEDVRAEKEAYRRGDHEKFLDREHGGVVYFVRCGSFVKIGHTTKPLNQRISAMKTGNPFDLTLIGLCPGDVSRERWFHKWLKDHHHRMEWFRMDDRFLRRVRSLLSRGGGTYFKEKAT